MTPYSVRRGIPGHVPDCLILEPGQASEAPPVVCVHGIARDAEAVAEALADAAERHGRTLVLPVFDRAYWPHYQRAACPQRADLALLALLDRLAHEQRITPGIVDLSGFSGGAQFAHRFTWLYPGRVGRLCVSSAGWWTFPDQTQPYPYGIGSSMEAPRLAGFWLRSNLRAFLDRNICIRVGENDCVVDANTRSGPRIDAQQGRDRVTRARRWARLLSATTTGLGLPDRVDFRLLPGCGHDFGDCARAGLDEPFVNPSSCCASHPPLTNRVCG